MRDVRLIHFFLPLAEADLHYLHARMADGLGGQGRHDELAVRYALLGVGHMRLGEHQNAGRRLLFAERSFTDPNLDPTALLNLGYADSLQNAGI